MVKTNYNENHPTATMKEDLNQTRKVVSKRKLHYSIKNSKEATIHEEDHDETCNSVNKMRSLEATLNELLVLQNRKIDLFFDCKPPSFGQNTDPLLATNWIFVLETIFNLIRCSDDEQKVAFAVLRLEDGALSWWRLEKLGLDGSDQSRVTWLKFKTLFFEKYFPNSIQLDKFRELCRMVQGHRTVAEYEVEFNELYSIGSKFIPDDAFKAALFEQGLRPEIREELCFASDMSYLEVRNAALSSESWSIDARERGIETIEVGRKE